MCLLVSSFVPFIWNDDLMLLLVSPSYQRQLVLVLGFLFTRNDQNFVIGLLSLVIFAMQFTKLKFPLPVFLLISLFLCLIDDDCPFPLCLFCSLMKFPLFRLVGSLLPASVALGSIDHIKKKYWAVEKKPQQNRLLVEVNQVILCNYVLFSVPLTDSTYSIPW